MSKNVITVELQAGPALSAAIEAFKAAGELLELVPDWHARERDELREKLERAIEFLEEVEDDG